MTTVRPVSSRHLAGRAWARESAASMADLGVLVPIAVALIVANGLSATAVLAPAGLTYLIAAAVYRVPVAVQPLKAFGAVAIAVGAGPDLIAAGALLMGVVFVVLGASGLLDRLARVFPTPVIRGVQLAVGLTFAKVAWQLVTTPPGSFVGTVSVGAGLLVAVLLVLVLLRGPAWVLLVVVAAGLIYAGSVAWPSDAVWGPTPVTVPHLDAATWWAAASLLVLPQVPLTLTNSCLAPADAARSYFPERSASVTPSRLALTLGGANLAVGALSGMPLCHGAGGMSAHYSFGGRTWRTPATIGSLLLVTALIGGAVLTSVLRAFPLPVLAALLVVAGIAHLRLLRDLRGPAQWLVATGVGVAGVIGNLGLAVLGGLALWSLWGWVTRR